MSRFKLFARLLRPADTDYSDDAVTEPTADEYRQLQKMHDQLQTMLFNEQQKAKELAALVEQLRKENSKLWAWYNEAEQRAASQLRLQAKAGE